MSNIKHESDQDIPSDVWFVWIIQYINQPISMKMYNDCQEIIKRYPKYFKTLWYE